MLVVLTVDKRLLEELVQNTFYYPHYGWDPIPPFHLGVVSQVLGRHTPRDAMLMGWWTESVEVDDMVWMGRIQMMGTGVWGHCDGDEEVTGLSSRCITEGGATKWDCWLDISRRWHGQITHYTHTKRGWLEGRFNSQHKVGDEDENKQRGHTSGMRGRWWSWMRRRRQLWCGICWCTWL